MKQSTGVVLRAKFWNLQSWSFRQHRSLHSICLSRIYLVLFG